MQDLILVNYACLWPRPTKGGARLYKLLDPVSFRQVILLFTFFDLRTGSNQFSDIGYWRNPQNFTCIDIFSVQGVLKTETAHAGVVFDSDKIVKG